MLLLWVDANIDENYADTQSTLQKLRKIIPKIALFTKIDQCVRYLDKIMNQRAVVITSGTFSRELVQQIHSLPQVDSIYIYCSKLDQHQVWAKKWSKIKGVSNRIAPICEAVRTAVTQMHEDLTPISFLTKNQTGVEGATNNPNRLDPSFMYTTLFKRIILTMEHERDERQAIVKFFRTYYAGNHTALAVVEEFSQNYQPDQAIWWYKQECFIYQVLNRGLRLLESDIIIDLGFFIHDLHRQLEKLHLEQFSNYRGQPLTLYRGQGISNNDLEKLKASRGGLIAFNNFLSTSGTKSIARDFAQRSSIPGEVIGTLFVMTVDPKIRSATFANIDKYNDSQFNCENEILFSMNIVFRIGGTIEKPDRENQLYEIQLTLTSDEDPKLRQVIDRIDKHVVSETGWNDLVRFLVDMGKLNKAEEICWASLKKKTNERDQRHYYLQLGAIKNEQGDYEEAVEYYEKAISINKKILHSTDLLFATCYTGIGLVYSNMKNYSEELFYLEKALGIRQRNLHANHPDLAISYNSLGIVYDSMGEYQRALFHYNNAIVIREKSLPSNHPDLATSYNNVGVLYDNMGNYSEALSYHKKALAIREEILPANHPELATSYSNIGGVYYEERQYSTAMPFFQKSLEIREKAYPPEHPFISESKRWIGNVRENLQK